MGVRSAFQLVLDLFGAGTSTAPAEPRVERPSSLRPTPPSPPAAPAGPVVPVVYSTRRRRGWRIVKEGGVWICQAPQTLRDAPPEIHSDLQEWARTVLKPHPGSKARRKEIERRIFAWMAPHSPDRDPVGNSKGETIDLQELFQELNRNHFEGRLEAFVRWSPRVGGLSTHQELKTRSGPRHLITISRAYDGKDVPRVAVAGVLFHEMCHIAHPPRPGRGGKRMVHHKEFRLAERRFPGWEEWRAWEARHLARRVRRLERLLISG